MISGSVINWTHKGDKQRYALNFQVAYNTDLDKLFELVREVCKSRPKVLSHARMAWNCHSRSERSGYLNEDIQITNNNIECTMYVNAVVYCGVAHIFYIFSSSMVAAVWVIG